MFYYVRLDIWRKIMATILDGKLLSNKIKEQLAERVDLVTARLRFTPILATILVGDDPASHTYVKMKKKATEMIGLKSEVHHLPKEATTEDVVKLIDQLNKNSHVRGILLQHPVPKHIDENLCFDTIAPEKDVDGVTSTSLGKTQKGKDITFSSATPSGIMRLLKSYNVKFEGKNAVVVGRSDILGKPVADLLTNEDCTVTLCHSKTDPKDLKRYVESADIVVGAVNIANFIKSDWIKDGAVVVDAGYIGKTGCVDYESKDNEGRTIIDKCSAYTPVPGGVGPMTIATLLHNTVVGSEKYCHNCIFERQEKRNKLGHIFNDCPTIEVK